MLAKAFASGLGFAKALQEEVTILLPSIQNPDELPSYYQIYYKGGNSTGS